MRLIGLIGFLLLAFNTEAFSGVIWQENFDTTPDWTSNEAYGLNIGYPGNQIPPATFDAYREGQSYWAGAPKHHIISGGVSAQGGAGRGLTINNESVPGFMGGGFMKYLGWPGYQRLFVRFSMKLPSNFCWQAPGASISGNGKLLRLTATRRALTLPKTPFDPSVYQSLPHKADNSPTSICNWYPRRSDTYPAQAIAMMEPRRAPDYNADLGQINYGAALFPSDADEGAVLTTPPDAPIPAGQGYCGDGKWHQYEYEHWMNSSPGIADGGYRVFKDGIKWAEKTDIAWVLPGTDSNGIEMTTATGWNLLWLPDNHMLLPYATAEKKSVQFYLDNIVAYSPITASDAEWAMSPQDGRLPLDYGVTDVIPIDVTPPTTAATPSAGVYTTPQTVTLTTEPGAVIYYTTNGSLPTINSSVYSAPIAVNATTTIRYFAMDTVGNKETVKTGIYTIDAVAAISGVAIGIGNGKITGTVK